VSNTDSATNEQNNESSIATNASDDDDESDAAIASVSQEIADVSNEVAPKSGANSKQLNQNTLTLECFLYSPPFSYILPFCVDFPLHFASSYFRATRPDGLRLHGCRLGFAGHWRALLVRQSIESNHYREQCRTACHVAIVHVRNVRTKNGCQHGSAIEESTEGIIDARILLLIDI
jgi:hypothetical protein